jgi:hypothetical protein
MTQNKPDDNIIHYAVSAQKDDNGDVLLPIPPELLKKLNWKQGDTIEFGVDESDNFILRKTN